jgi:predicted DNA-binding ArsR family transcriptional regulator
MTKEKEPSLLSSTTIIRDPKIEPFFISKDAYCYTIYKTVTPDIRYTEGNKPGKDYLKALGHYSNFGSCLKALAKEKIDDNKSYNSIHDYIDSFKKVEEEIKTLLNILD